MYLTEEKLKDFGVQDARLWTPRNERMFRHRRLFELRKPPKNRLKPGQIVAVTNDAKAIVKKFASMIANHLPTIDIPMRDDAVRLQSQRAEDYIRYFREEESLKFGDGPNGDMAYTEAENLVRDGMLVNITTFDITDPEFPWCSELPDAATVYPVYGGNYRIRTTIVQDDTVSGIKRLMEQYGDVLENISDRWEGKKDDDQVKVTKVFTGNKEQGYEMGVLADGKAIFLGELGYDPITITYAGGRSYSTPKESDSATTGRVGVTGVESMENIGVGIFDIIEEPLVAKNQDYSMLREMMARESNPPTVLFTDDEDKVGQIDLDAGASMVFWQGDKFQLVNTNPDFAKFTAGLTIAQQGIERGSLPAALYGESNSNTGVQEYMLMGNARDMVYPYVRGMERYYRAKYRKVLELYRDYGYQDLEYSGGRDQSDPGITLGGQKFSIEDVKALGRIQVIVTYPEVTPQNEASRANMATSLTREKILDLYSARQMLPSPWNDNPEAIGQRVLQDLSLMNPMMTQLLSLSAAMTSPHELVRILAGMLIDPMIQQLYATTLGAGGAGGGQAPPPGGEMAPAANPSELGSRAGLTQDQPSTGAPGSDQGL